MKHFIFTCIFLCACAFVKAQSPQLISYQAVARDLTGKVLSEKPISVQVEILRGSNAGTVVYTETHELTTTKTGTINLLIGGGDKVGENDFSTIDWSQSPYFLRLGLKQEKKSEYTEVVNTQMVSVPYALYAEKAGSVVNEGEEEPSDGTIQYGRDFIIACAGDSNDNILLYTIFGGGTIHVYLESGGYLNPSEIVFTIIYMQGEDLQLSAEIEGMELDEKYTSQSTLYGRSYDFRLVDLDRKEYVLEIKDKDNEVLLSYPFNVEFE